MPNPQTKIEIRDDHEVCLVGKSSLALRVAPDCYPISLLYPQSKNAGIPLAGKTALVFWVKMINTNIHAWQGFMPLVTLYESPTKRCQLQPQGGWKNLAGRRRLELQDGPPARQRRVEAEGRGPRDVELDNH